MRIWNLCVSIAILALAFSYWRFGDRTTNSPEHASMDGTCRCIQALEAYFLALVLGALSIVPLFVRKQHVDRWIDEFNREPEAAGDETWKDGMVAHEGKEYDRLYD